MIAIRALQHFLYCPHRWGMLYLEGQWKDNAFTVLADQIHSRVHSEKVLRQSNKVTSFGGITVYSESLGIHGKADLIEFVRDTDGVPVDGLDGKFNVNIVEFKPTQPKSTSAADRVQLYAQWRCAREIFGGKVDAYLYYSDVRRRFQQVFNEEDEQLLSRLISEINDATEKQIIPPPRYGKKCNGCSLADMCMPRVSTEGVKAMILEGNL